MYYLIWHGGEKVNKQLVAILLALAVGIGFSGAAAAQNVGYAAQTTSGNQYASSGMTYSGMNPIYCMIGSYLVKFLYLIHMVLMGGYMPGGMMGTMPMPGTATGTEGTATGTEGTATGAEGTATGTEGTATGTE